MSTEGLGVTTTPAMRNPRRRTIEGIDTVFHDEGNGETIIFIFGGNFGSSEAGSSTHAWDLNFVPLADRFRVVAFDKIGQGFTGNPLRDEDYTMAAVVRHAAAFIETLDANGVHLVGHSRGGFCATRVALEYPHLVKSLTIVSSGTLSPTISPNEITLAGNPHPPYSRASSRWVYEGYCHDPRAVTEDWVDRSVEVANQPQVKIAVQKMVREGLAHRYFLPELARQKRETLQWLREGRLQRPVEIIWGANDRTVAVQGAFEIFGMISPHQRMTEISMFNHCGHFPYREHPARFNELLSRFVDDVSA
ncbi:alpha/beta fold hydrolase [Sphingobium aquiterrae]|uniref:alpha/beta fold hydrolase n=1 Tax=Sphingobium aquiterrae TaxID=2038656 RepID=UPI003017FE76